MGDHHEISHKDLMRAAENEAWVLQRNPLLVMRNDAEQGRSPAAETRATSSLTQYEQHLPAVDAGLGRSWQTLSVGLNKTLHNMSPEDARQILNYSRDSGIQLLQMNNFNTAAGTTGGVDYNQFNSNHNLGLDDSGLSKQTLPHHGEIIGIMPPPQNHNTEGANITSFPPPEIQHAGINAAMLSHYPHLTTNFASNSNATGESLSDAIQHLYLQNMELELYLRQLKGKLLLLQQQVHSFSQRQDLPLQQSMIMNHQMSIERTNSMPGSLFHATFLQQPPRTDHLEQSTIGTTSLGDERESSLKDRDVGSPQDYSIPMEQDLEPNSGHETFPMKLHRLLEDLELRHTNGTEIASFTSDGLSFIVKDTVEFETKIMPLYFPRMKHFASFQRQLNLYDFQRVGGRTAQKGAYRHRMFLRSMPQLAKRMRRTKRKGPKSNVDFLGIGNLTGL
jgi:hypothetical protein